MMDDIEAIAKQGGILRRNNFISDQFIGDLIHGIMNFAFLYNLIKYKHSG